MTISSRLRNKACLSTMELLIPSVYLPGSRPIILRWTAFCATFLFLSQAVCYLATSYFVLKSLRMQGYLEQAQLIRYTCVETPALRNLRNVVPFVWCTIRFVFARCSGSFDARCAVGRLAVRVVAFPLILASCKHTYIQVVFVRNAETHHDTKRCKPKSLPPSLVHTPSHVREVVRRRLTCFRIVRTN
jgi:hypothetical protein